MKIGYNGSVTDADQAVISVYDHGFLYGMGLFETFRTYGGRPFLLNRHMARLKAGCAELGLACGWDEASVADWLERLMRANGLAEAYVRLTIAAGAYELGLPASAYERTNALLMVKPLPPADDRLYVAGRQLRLLRSRRNTPETAVRLKSLHYMNNIVAKRELAASGAAPGAEGLMLTRDGWLAEGIVSNLFFVKDGAIRTPHTDTGILPGITRAVVLELAEITGLPAEQGFYTWDDLLDAEEAWVTNSVQELVPVTSLADERGSVRPVGGGTVGETTGALLAAYRRLTRQGDAPSAAG